MFSDKIRKILLISPPGKITTTKEGSQERKLAVPPLGLASLAARLLEEGFDVEILDVMVEGYNNEQIIGQQIIYGLDDDDVRRRIAEFGPDMVGVSCLFSNRGKEALHLCSLAKETLPGVHVVLGGQHPSGMPSLILHDDVDYILFGEADNSLVQLIQTINAGGDLMQVDQIILKKGGDFWKSPNNNYPDPRILPLPAWDLVDMKKYWDVGLADYGVDDSAGKRFMIMITSRGCPHACYFCTVPMMSDRRFRMKDVAKVIDEIRHYRDVYGIEELFFWDDNFFINKKRTKELLRGIAANFPGLSCQITSGSEVNAIDDEVIELLPRAGFSKLPLAVESFNPDIQEAVIDKHVDLSRISDVVEKLRRNGIVPEGSFMVGFPHETKSQIDNTLNMASKLGFERISISIVNPLPGTALYKECMEEGILYDDFDPQNVRWSTENIRIDSVQRGYISKRRREVWVAHMKGKINIEKYETTNLATTKSL